MVQDALAGKIAPFNATLKDDSHILIREAVIQDAADLIRCVKSYMSDSEYLVMEPDEFSPDTAQGREFIRNLIETENSLLIVAEHNERIVGNLDITGGQRKRIRHTGLVGMGMLKQYRSIGLGTLLLKTGIKWAQKNPILEKLWLQLLAPNEPAIKLYQKMGFLEEGRQKDFIKMSKDRNEDNLIMALTLV